MVPLRALLLALAITAAGPGQAEVTVVDDAGDPVRLTAPARRIVSLAPHTTELLYAAGAGERLIAATAYSDYPPPAARLPRVGDAHAVDLERVLALRPDLVVAWISGNNAAQVARLVQAGVTVFRSEPRRAEDVASNLERLGRLAGSEAEARAAAAQFRAALAALTREFRDIPPYRLFYEIWHQPLMTLNGAHMVSDLVGRCGARNVFAAEPALVPTVSLEAVMAAAPQAIASGAGESALAFWRSRAELPAAASGRICAVDATRMHRSGPRMIDAARELCACLTGR